MFKNAAEIFAYIKKEDVKLVDVRFTDLPGIQHHFNVPVESFDEAVFSDGLKRRLEAPKGLRPLQRKAPKPATIGWEPFSRFLRLWPRR